MLLFCRISMKQLYFRFPGYTSHTIYDGMKHYGLKLSMNNYFFMFISLSATLVVVWKLMESEPGNADLLYVKKEVAPQRPQLLKSCGLRVSSQVSAIANVAQCIKICRYYSERMLDALKSTGLMRSSMAHWLYLPIKSAVAPGPYSFIDSEAKNYSLQ